MFFSDKLYSMSTWLLNFTTIIIVLGYDWHYIWQKRCLIDSLIEIMSDKTAVWLTGGFYCPGSAVVSPDLPCSAGYFCKQGAKTATPVQGQYADPCPVGHYCPEQNAEPIQCPVGTFSNNIKLRNVTDCLQCTRGECCLVGQSVGLSIHLWSVLLICLSIVCVSISPSIVCVSVCPLSVCLCASVCLSISLSVCLSVCLSLCLSLSPSVRNVGVQLLSIHHSVHEPSIFLHGLSTCLSIDCLSILHRLPICLCIYYLSIHLSQIVSLIFW